MRGCIERIPTLPLSTPHHSHAHPAPPPPSLSGGESCDLLVITNFKDKEKERIGPITVTAMDAAADATPGGPNSASNAAATGRWWDGGRRGEWGYCILLNTSSQCNARFQYTHPHNVPNQPSTPSINTPSIPHKTPYQHPLSTHVAAAAAGSKQLHSPYTSIIIPSPPPPLNTSLPNAAIAGSKQLHSPYTSIITPSTSPPLNTSLPNAAAAGSKQLHSPYTSIITPSAPPPLNTSLPNAAIAGSKQLHSPYTSIITPSTSPPLNTSLPNAVAAVAAVAAIAAGSKQSKESGNSKSTSGGDNKKVGGRVD